MRACFRRPKYGWRRLSERSYGNHLIPARKEINDVFKAFHAVQAGFVCSFRDCRFTMGGPFDLIIEQEMNLIS
jgi:hypothetical protein